MDYITQVFKDKNAAEKGYQIALKYGYKPEEIIVLMSEEVRNQHYESSPISNEDTEDFKHYTVTGAIGSTIGLTLGALIALGSSLVLPGLGLILIGPLAGAGFVSGGIVGGLCGLGLSEDIAKHYEQEVKSGSIVLSVTKKVGTEQLEYEWQQCNKSGLP